MNKREFDFYKKLFEDEDYIKEYGKFRMGLSSKEIDFYLSVRANTQDKRKVKSLRNKFNNIAGCNTCALAIINENDEVDPFAVVLMYRWDVKRFADVLFNGTPTYFD